MQNPTTMTANNAKRANTAEPPKPKKEAGVSTPDGERAASLNDLGPDIANALREIEVAAEDQFDRWEHFVSLDNRSKKEKAEIRRLEDKQRKLRAKKRDLSSREAARLSELRNERAIAELENAENIAEKEQAHPYQEQIDEITSERLGRPLVWEAIHEPEKLLARINHSSNRKNQKDRAAQDSAAKSHDRLSLIFWRIGTELASASPEGWAEELLANPDLTLRRLEAFVKGCVQLRGDAPKGAKIERRLVTLEAEPFVHAEAKRSKKLVEDVRCGVQAEAGFKVDPHVADKFARQVRKKADESKLKNALRRKST